MQGRTHVPSSTAVGTERGAIVVGTQCEIRESHARVVACLAAALPAFRDLLGEGVLGGLR